MSLPVNRDIAKTLGFDPKTVTRLVLNVGINEIPTVEATHLIMNLPGSMLQARYAMQLLDEPVLLPNTETVDVTNLTSTQFEYVKVPDVRLWIVGQFHTDARWTFAGCFSSEDKAVEACRDETYFVGPCKLDKPIPHEDEHWPGCYYPKAEAA